MNKTALAAYFAEVHDKPARLGGLDCVRFVIDGLLIGWQRDFRHRLGYWDRRSAIVRLRAAGGLESAFTEVFGKPVAVDDLVPGDVAFLPQSAVGLVMPEYVALKYQRTIVRVKKEFCIKGWHGRVL